MVGSVAIQAGFGAIDRAPPLRVSNDNAELLSREREIAGGLGAPEVCFASGARFPLDCGAGHIGAARLGFRGDPLLLSATEPSRNRGLRNGKLTTLDRSHERRRTLGDDGAGTFGAGFVDIDEPRCLSPRDTAICGICSSVHASRKIRDLRRNQSTLVVA